MQVIRKTVSICPVCLKKISASIVEEQGKIYLRKRCKKHGDFEDLYYADLELYRVFMKYADKTDHGDDRFDLKEDSCPYNCGICNEHKSSTVLANIDVTNGCNFKCPVCFANSEVTRYHYQPTVETIGSMMDVLRNLHPPCEVIQFSGGEPTIRKDFLDIARMAKEKGFIHIQLATNGKVLAENPDYARRLNELKFDTSRNRKHHHG